MFREESWANILFCFLDILTHLPTVCGSKHPGPQVLCLIAFGDFFSEITVPESM